MALAKNYSYKTPKFKESGFIEINLDSLILAMVTAFDVDFTSQEILINVQELFDKLNFCQPRNLTGKIKDSIRLLTNEGYLCQEDGKYLISHTGRGFGIRALQNFQEFALNTP
ncbi:MAG: hypothetical protein ACW97P_07590 [Candidatus Hodarchaeales archaeon]|jgi:hypothetical protein